MKKILFIFTLVLIGCSTTKQIPVQSVEKIIYKDTIITIKDTLKIEVPKEIVKEIAPQIDTSYIKTSLAESTAYLDTTERKLHHTLKQTGVLKVKYDTIISVQYVDRVITKDVPIEVEVIKYKRDTFFWVLLGWALLCICYAIIKLK